MCIRDSTEVTPVTTIGLFIYLLRPFAVCIFVNYTILVKHERDGRSVKRYQSNGAGDGRTASRGGCDMTARGAAQ